MIQERNEQLERYRKLKTLLLLVSIMFFLTGYMDYRSTRGSCEMRFNQSIEAAGVNGLYHHGDYFCVWVKDRNVTEIVGSQTHELCHHLVYVDRDHFCG